VFDHREIVGCVTRGFDDLYPELLGDAGADPC
jgi:hypothetical protein